MAAGRPEAAPAGGTPGVVADFQTVWRGFDQEQVRSHLGRLTGRLEELESRLHRTQRMLDDARRERDLARNAAGLGSFEGVSAHVVDLVRRFDMEVEGLRKQAEAQAQGARASAEEALRTTREEAYRLQGELDSVREATLSQMREMRARLAICLGELDMVLDRLPSAEPVVVVDEAEVAAGESVQAAGPRPDFGM